jgi:hypothetical protein
MTRKTWWMARNRYRYTGLDIINTFYVLSERKPSRSSMEPYRTRWDSMLTNQTISPRVMHRVSTFRLKPGDGPIQVTLELTVRRVR